jgi:tetratricopeptide (TPR) repeat protein
LRDLPAAVVARVCERLGDAASLAGHERQASAAYAEALRRVRGDAVAEAALCRKIGRMREKSRSVTQALSWYTRGLRRLSGSDDPRAAAVRAQLVLAHGGARMRAGRLREALPHLERALDEEIGRAHV